MDNIIAAIVIFYVLFSLSFKIVIFTDFFKKKKDNKSIEIDFSKMRKPYGTDYSNASYMYLISEYAKIREELKKREKETPKNTKDSKSY